MSRIKLVTLLLACFAIIAASPLAMGVTIYGGTLTSTSGSATADGSAGTTASVTDTSTTTVAVLDAYIYSHARATGVGYGYAHYQGSASAPLTPNSADSKNLGTFQASVTGDTNAGAKITGAAATIDSLALIGSKVMRSTGASGAFDQTKPVKGSAFVFSKVSGDAVTALPLGGSTTLPELSSAGLFKLGALTTAATTGEAYAHANGAASFQGTATKTSATSTSGVADAAQINGNVNADTYVDGTLTNSQVSAVSAVVASAIAEPASPTTPGEASYAKAGMVTQLWLKEGSGGRSNGTATATKGTGADVAAKAGAWDRTFTGSKLIGQNENAYATADGDLSSESNVRLTGDEATTGARMNVIASHDLGTTTQHGAQDYAATVIQTYGAGIKTTSATSVSQLMSYGSLLDNADSYSIARDNTADYATQSTAVGALNPTFTEGFSAGGHMLSQPAVAGPQYASSLFTQEAFGNLQSNANPGGSDDAVVINRQDTDIANIQTATQNDPYGFWVSGAANTDPFLPSAAGVIKQGLTNNGPKWNGVVYNDVGSHYGLSTSANANVFDNVLTTGSLSDINWIEGSSLYYSISNLQKSFTYSPSTSSHNEYVNTQVAVPGAAYPGTPYQKVQVSQNYAA